MTRERIYRWTGVLAVAAAMALAARSGSAQPPELRIGLIPEMNVFEQVERYRRLADYLSRQVDRPIRLTMLSRYGNIVQRMVGQDVDGAFLGSFTGALASAQLGMQPVARPINLDGSSTYWGYIFVRKDSGISTVEQMRGARLALVERATTAGYVFPVAYFRRHGVDDLDNHFSDIQFWGSHDASIRAVLSGRADVGAAKNTIWEHLVQEDPRVERELRILATSPRVPSNGLFISSTVAPSVAEGIRSSLLELHESPHGAEILSALRVEGFVPTDAASYEPVMELAREAGIDLAAYTYSNE
jgi:phosphonate transport system substrate-binding protein